MNTILFDLDGTLLPMDQNKFIEIYFHSLAKHCETMGYDADDMSKGIWAGTKAMLLNNGEMRNQERFWNTFSSIFGEEVRKLEPEFERFYRNEFSKAKVATYPTTLANECIQILKNKGYKLVLATNPLFPQIATYTRMEWAGINPTDFELITTYENSSYCKPNLEYYKGILKIVGKEPSDCMMIGNDVKEDMCASLLGMETFLLTDCLIHNGEDIEIYNSGRYDEFLNFVHKMPESDAYISSIESGTTPENMEQIEGIK